MNPPIPNKPKTKCCRPAPTTPVKFVIRLRNKKTPAATRNTDIIVSLTRGFIFCFFLEVTFLAVTFLAPVFLAPLEFDAML